MCNRRGGRGGPGEERHGVSNPWEGQSYGSNSIVQKWPQGLAALSGPALGWEMGSWAVCGLLSPTSSLSVSGLFLAHFTWRGENACKPQTIQASVGRPHLQAHSPLRLSGLHPRREGCPPPGSGQVNMSPGIRIWGQGIQRQN